jgi:threonine/homoserine/homoserine lactone efflux protein
MDPSYFLRGLIIGFSIAAPVGPIGILCINRTLAYGRVYGFLSGLGAATADAVYGSMAAFGLTIISGFLVQQQFWLQLVGGIFLCFLGTRTFFAQAAKNSVEADPGSKLNAYGSTFFLTLTNPVTILAFAAIFAGLGLAGASKEYASAAIMVLGVFLGSAFWWLLLSSITGLLKDRISPTGLKWVNRISGLIIFGFGIVALVNVISRIL